MSATNLLDRLKAAPNEWRTANAINVELAPDLRSAEIRAALASLVRTGQVISQGPEDKREYAMRGIARTRTTPPAPQVEAVCEVTPELKSKCLEAIAGVQTYLDNTEMQRLAAELQAIDEAHPRNPLPELQGANGPSVSSLDDWYREKQLSRHVATEEPAEAAAADAIAFAAEQKPGAGTVSAAEMKAVLQPVESIAEAIRRVLRESGQPMTSVQIRAQVPHLLWARVSTSLSDQVKSGHLLRSTPENGEYHYTLAPAQAPTATAAERQRQPVLPAKAIRAALMTATAHADAALDAVLDQLDNPLLTAVVRSSQSNWRACAHAGVTP